MALHACARQETQRHEAAKHEGMLRSYGSPSGHGAPRPPQGAYQAGGQRATPAMVRMGAPGAMGPAARKWSLDTQAAAMFSPDDASRTGAAPPPLDRAPLSLGFGLLQGCKWHRNFAFVVHPDRSDLADWPQEP